MGEMYDSWPIQTGGRPAFPWPRNAAAICTASSIPTVAIAPTSPSTAAVPTRWCVRRPKTTASYEAACKIYERDLQNLSRIAALEQKRVVNTRNWDWLAGAECQHAAVAYRDCPCSISWRRFPVEEHAGDTTVEDQGDMLPDAGLQHVGDRYGLGAIAGCQFADGLRGKLAAKHGHSADLAAEPVRLVLVRAGAQRMVVRRHGGAPAACRVAARRTPRLPGATTNGYLMPELAAVNRSAEHENKASLAESLEPWLRTKLSKKLL
jgi:hypothetical protein